MLAGGMAAAVPSMVPEAAAAGALYVSAENAQFDNLFGGPSIVEVIVKDPNRSMVNESAGEPTVLVYNKKLRMAQGFDGNWYGYFGDKTDVGTLVTDGANDQLLFPAAATLTLGTSGTHSLATEAGSTILAYPKVISGGGVIDNPPTLSNWNSSGIVDGNAVGSNTRTDSACLACGQISVASGEWPFIQVFDFTIGTFDVKLEQVGSDEIVSLDHNSADLDDYASLSLDRNSGPQGADIHVYIVDQALNVDPTDEDVVIFKVANGGGNNSTANVVFTNGTINHIFTAGTTTKVIPWNTTSSGFNFGDNGLLKINNNTAGATVAVFDKASNTLDDTADSVSVGVSYLIHRRWG